MHPAHDVNTRGDTRKSNARLAWILASAALVFALGFVAKVWLFAR
jgi:hypothetical protein